MAKDYSRIITKITSTPWMITPDALKLMLDIFDAHLTGKLDTEQIAQKYPRRNGMLDLDMGSDEPISRRIGSVGVLNLHGPIFPKSNLMTHLSGATSLDQFRNEFRSMVSDPSISTILLDVDSPGGLSDLVDEMASEVHAAAQVMPIYSIANTSANSAAYYIASQATHMYATPSGQLGSIGTYLVHTDESQALEKIGIKETVIKSGRFKAASIEPLTDDSKDHLQQFVNDTNEGFIAAVARGRGTTVDDVRENYGEGGVVTPKYALDHGMIDGIATFDEVLNSLSSINTTGGVAISSNSGYGYLNTAGEFVPLMLTGTGTSSNTGNMIYPVVVPGRQQSYDADKEHSEPGTGQGGEPTPREPPETGDKAIEGGWRRDPPPIAYETEEMVVNRTWLEGRATALGIEFNDETTDEALADLVTSHIDEIVVPLSAATADAERLREFEQLFPEQARQLAELTSRNRLSEAATFADNFAKFENSSKGYSTLVREKIEDAHLKIASRQFSHEDLSELLTLTASKDAIVEWGEKGSSRSEDKSDAVTPTNNFAEDRKKFAELVRSAMTEDNLSRDAAIAHVSEQHPELAKAYLYGHAAK